MTHTVEVYTRGPDRGTTGGVTTWSRLDLVARRNDVGRWTITVESAQDAALFAPGSGVIIRRGGVTVLSGWTAARRFSKQGAVGQWVFGGWDDTVYLADTTCWPKPSAVITSQTDKDHVVTGAASTRVIAYWQANVMARLGIAGTASGADPTLGASGTSRARFHTLLELAQQACGKSVNVRVVQSGGGALIQPVFALPRDLRLAVQFSPEVGTVTGYDWSDVAPTATRVALAANNTGAARVFRGYLDTAAEQAWSSVRRPETFLDRRDLTSTDGTFTAEAAEAGAEALLDGRRRSTFGMTVTDTEGLRYGVDYLVGDLVRAYPEPGEPIDDLVEEVTVSFNAEQGETAQVWVGPREESDEVDARRERDLRRRIARLEKAQ
jgi:hypothetical protein